MMLNFRLQRDSKIKTIPLAPVLAIVLMLAIVFLGAQPAGAGTLTVPGSGACEHPLRKLAEAFNEQNPAHEVIIPKSIGTHAGYLAAETGESIIARVGRPPKGEEAGYGLNYLIFARDAVVFAVGAKVKMRSLTATQLADIFSGKTGDWQQVGGSKSPIRVLVREKGEVSLSIIQKHLEPFRDIVFTDSAKTLYHDYEMLEMLNKYKRAIGFLTACSIVNAPVKPLAIDNIMPSPENILTGKYALSAEYALVYKEGRLNELGGKFIDFIFSANGKRILKNNGLIPVDRR